MNTATKDDAIIVFGLQQKNAGFEWRNFPDQSWWSLVNALTDLGVDGVGFEGILNSEDLSKYPYLPPMSFKSAASYVPYHGKKSKDLAVFAFDAAFAEWLKKEAFDQWDKSNPNLPFDELVFFKRNVVKILAIPYENFLFVKEVSKEDVEVLKGAGQQLANNLYSRDLSQKLVV